MKVLKLAILVLAVLAVLAAVRYFGGGKAAGPTASAVTWTMDYEAGLARAKSTGRPVMLFFTADWCGYCTLIRKEVFAREDVGRAADKLVNIWLDVDKERDLARDYRIRGVPSLIFLSPQGEPLGLYNGPREPGPIIAAMRDLAKRYP